MTSSSHVVEGDPSSWKTSYVENATNLFNKDVPVCVKGGGPDGAQEKIEELTVQILLGLNKQKQSKVRSGRARPIPSALASARTQGSLARAASRARAASLTISPPLPPPPSSRQVLRVQVTSETDPFFFHHMEVSEDEFQSLKVEQSILVDFAQFPDKFIELLEECIASRGEENPRFLAVLRVGADGEPDQNPASASSRRTSSSTSRTSPWRSSPATTPRSNSISPLASWTSRASATASPPPTATRRLPTPPRFATSSSPPPRRSRSANTPSASRRRRRRDSTSSRRTSR